MTYYIITEAFALAMDGIYCIRPEDGQFKYGIVGGQYVTPAINKTLFGEYQGWEDLGTIEADSVELI